MKIIITILACVTIASSWRHPGRMEPMFARRSFEDRVCHDYAQPLMPKYTIDENEYSYKVTAHLPGVQKYGVRLDYQPGQLVVSAHRAARTNCPRNARRNAHRQLFTLPETVRGEDMQYSIDNENLLINVAKPDKTNMVTPKELSDGTNYQPTRASTAAASNDLIPEDEYLEVVEYIDYEPTIIKEPDASSGYVYRGDYMHY